jgi:hypothetical protein
MKKQNSSFSQTLRDAAIKSQWVGFSQRVPSLYAASLRTVTRFLRLTRFHISLGRRGLRRAQGVAEIHGTAVVLKSGGGFFVDVALPNCSSGALISAATLRSPL